MHSVEEQIARLERTVVDLIDRRELRERLEAAHRDGRKLRVKLGMDPTGYHIHLGHTVVLRKLRAFQDLGHQAVLIIGDATAMIGDPSGRDKTRPVLTREAVEEYAQGWLEQVRKVLDVDALEVRRNSEFYEGMSFPDVVRLCGRMTVAQMLERNDFSERYRGGNPISLHEFLYPLMQGWDSVCVDADVELGGTDQLFNLHVGRAFQEAEGRTPQIVMTTPIVEGTDGVQKMSKSYDNAIGIDEPADEIFGKLMSIPDTMMEKYFVHFTSLPDDEIATILGGHPRDAKMRLGVEIVSWLHDSSAAEAAKARFIEVFAKRNVPDEMPSHRVDPGPVGIRELIRTVGFAKSGGEAKRLIQQGAVTWDGDKISDPDASVDVTGSHVLKVGKRRFCRVHCGE